MPFLGICLGLQLLFERSHETPGVEGLGILEGEILRIPEKDNLKIPHMGWNSLKFPGKGRLFAALPEDSYVYFVHSYRVSVLILCLDDGPIREKHLLTCSHLIFNQFDSLF